MTATVEANPTDSLGLEPALREIYWKTEVDCPHPKRISKNRIGEPLLVVALLRICLHRLLLQRIAWMIEEIQATVQSKRLQWCEAGPPVRPKASFRYFPVLLHLREPSLAHQMLAPFQLVVGTFVPA